MGAARIGRRKLGWHFGCREIASGLYQQYACRRIFTEPRGEDATSRAATDDQEVYWFGR